MKEHILVFVFCFKLHIPSVFCIFEGWVHFKGVCGGETVSDVRPYLAPVDELIEANYKRERERGRGEEEGKDKG